MYKYDIKNLNSLNMVGMSCMEIAYVFSRLGFGADFVYEEIDGSLLVYTQEYPDSKKLPTAITDVDGSTWQRWDDIEVNFLYITDENSMLELLTTYPEYKIVKGLMWCD